VDLRDSHSQAIAVPRTESGEFAGRSIGSGNYDSPIELKSKVRRELLSDGFTPEA